LDCSNGEKVNYLNLKSKNWRCGFSSGKLRNNKWCMF
jgi:hypothetical protein